MPCFLRSGSWIVISACAAAPAPPHAAITFDACTPPQIVTDAGISAVQLAGIAAAQASWRTHGAPLLGIVATGTLALHFQQAAPLYYGFYDDAAGAIYVNADLTDSGTLSVVVAHEIGHAFGLVHVDPHVRSSVMNPGNLVVEPTAEDQLALEAIWGVCATGS